jgi:hypothetical protein
MSEGWIPVLPLGQCFVLPTRIQGEEGTPSMDSRTAATGITDPDAIEFVQFCYRRRRVGWPELYDEMCAVAARGLFRGYDADDLAGLGIGFSLFDMPALAVLSGRVIAEEQALRRVGVRIPADTVARDMASLVETTAETPVETPRAVPQPVPMVREERTFDVPVHLVMVPSVA